MKRRDFIFGSTALLSVSPFFQSCAARTAGKKMVILGIDGMDPGIVQRLVKKGVMPNVAALAEKGTFTMMRSTIPPQSPVAWGSFISGSDPGYFGIFDFVHRDPETYLPSFSLSEHTQPSWLVNVGKYRLPLKPGKMILKREGKAFWDFLQNHDIGAVICKIPSNFPPSPSRQHTLSGMGTPDLLGGNGIFTLYTTDENEFQRDLSPHYLYYADIDENGVMHGLIDGPTNDLLKESETTTAPFTLYADRVNRTIRIDIQGKTILMAEKEYSPWIPIEFPLIGALQTIKGMVKFYLLEMGDHFRLYISPVQLHPSNPALPISTPGRFAADLAKRCGLFHTLGLPADFNAIKTGIFSIENYIVQSESVFDESERMFDSELDRFCFSEDGFLFFYFSSLDQGQHIFWGLTDPDHPFYHPEESRVFGHITEDFYRRCDKIIGRAMKKIPPGTSLVVMSDHGFAPFYKEVNLNAWLWKEGYLKIRKGAESEPGLLALNADWSGSRAYGIGLNGIYVNLRGREAEGRVERIEKRRLLEELKNKIESIVDPQTGERVVSRAYISEDHYSRNQIERAPDIEIGFNRGYRAADQFGEGNFSPVMIADNRNWWTGDHCIDPLKVPAIFLANFPIKRSLPHIMDLAPTILDYFGIKTPAHMRGRSLL